MTLMGWYGLCWRRAARRGAALTWQTQWVPLHGAACCLLYGTSCTTPLVRHLHEERGVAFAPGTLAAAARGGCVPVVEWLVGAGCRAGEPTVGEGDLNEPYVAAAGGPAGHGIADMDTLSCLRRMGVPWNVSVLRWAVRKGVSLRVLRWMVEQRASWDEDILRAEVARVRREEVVYPWKTGVHSNDNVEWFAERLGIRAAGSAALGR